MISFNDKDYNMSKVQEASRLTGKLTKNSYRIFGLKQCNDKPVFIKYGGDAANTDIITKIVSFLSKNGVQVELDYGSHYRSISIGLRVDLREDIDLTTGVLLTIIHALEKKLVIDDNFVLKNVPFLE